MNEITCITPNPNSALTPNPTPNRGIIERKRIEFATNTSVATSK